MSFDEWWPSFYAHVEGTIDRNTAHLVYDYMHRQQPKPEIVSDWAEKWLSVQKSLNAMAEAASDSDMAKAERHAANVREAACCLVRWFNERM